METLIWASSHPFWILGLFLFALAGFHYAFLVRWPLGPAGWKLTEYVWVALALISVLGFVEQARSFRARLEGNAARAEAEMTLGQLDNWVRVYEGFACDDKATDPAYEALCLWVGAKRRALDLIAANESFPPDIPANLLDGAASVGMALQADDLKPVQTYLAAYVTARRDYLASQAAVGRSDFSRLSIGLAPILLAIALALRMTKVTGEYRLARRKA